MGFSQVYSINNSNAISHTSLPFAHSEEVADIM